MAAGIGPEVPPPSSSATTIRSGGNSAAPATTPRHAALGGTTTSSTHDGLDILAWQQQRHHHHHQHANSSYSSSPPIISNAPLTSHQPRSASTSTPASAASNPAVNRYTEGGSNGSGTISSSSSLHHGHQAHLIVRSNNINGFDNGHLQHASLSPWSDASTLNLLSETAARQAVGGLSRTESRSPSFNERRNDHSSGGGGGGGGIIGDNTSKNNKRASQGGHKKATSSTTLAPTEADSSCSRGQSESDHEAGDPGSPADQSAEATEEEKKRRKKRIKTARACDSCRRKKIRCDVIEDGSPPPGDPNNGNGGLTCAHCRQYGFSCTFFLPITETRFKKKREREAEAAAVAAASSSGNHPHGSPGAMFPGAITRPGVAQRFPSHGSAASPLNLNITPAAVSATQEWPPRSLNHPLSTSWDGRIGSAEVPSAAISAYPLSLGSAGGALGQRLERLAPPMSNDSGPPPGSDQGPPPDARVMGPTSLAYIVHSTAFVPGSAIEAHDLKHSQTFEVGASGDGIIKLNRSRHRHPSSADSCDEDDSSVPQLPDAIRGRLTGDVAEKLVNSYFEKLGYLWPVITKSEFLHLSQPPPLLFYSICGVAALDRNVPIEVLSAVRLGLNSIFKDSDVLSNSSANTVKALLILSLHSDIHGSGNLQSGTRLWNRLGTALRMAQDLGLHRDASGRDDLDEFAHFLEQKRRIWGACVSADRCVSIALGHPLAIDLTDCDVRLPSPYEIQRYSTDLPSISGLERPFAFNTEMLKLSILFGRVQKTIYSPTGLMKASDEEIVGLLSDIDQWRENLPEDLRFAGPTSVPHAGILHLSHACIQMLFFRVFMRISYSCPQHLKFSLTIERMTSMVRWSRESIAWVDVSGDFYLDTMQFISYALVFCATIQYHSWIRRGDEEGLKALTQLKDIFTRSRQQDGQKQDMSLRAKTAEIVSLLCEAAQGHWANTPSTGNLNPTAGVVNRRTVDSVRGIIWRNAPGRPGGGVFEAADASLLLSDLPNGTIILGPNKTPALVMTSANGWQPVPGVLPEQSATAAMDPSPDDCDLPDLSNFTYLGGSIWQDQSGRPVDRRGSGLVVVLPTNSNNQANGEHLAGGHFQTLQQQHDNQYQLQNINVNPHLNHLSAMDQAFAGQQGAPLMSLLGGGGDGGSSNSDSNLLQNGAIGNTNTSSNNNNTNKNTYEGLPLFGPNAPNCLSPSDMGMVGMAPDPLMLNDPLMNMLDWQAWQTYLAPFSSLSNTSFPAAGTGTGAGAGVSSFGGTAGGGGDGIDTGGGGASATSNPPGMSLGTALNPNGVGGRGASDPPGSSLAAIHAKGGSSHPTNKPPNALGTRSTVV